MTAGILSSWTPGNIRKLKRLINRGLNNRQLAVEMGVTQHVINNIISNEADDLQQVSLAPVPRERARTHVDFGNGVHGPYNPDLKRRMEAKSRKAQLQKLYAASQERDAAAKAANDVKLAGALNRMNERSARLAATLEAAENYKLAGKIEIMDAAGQALDIGFDNIKQAKHLVAAIYQIPVEAIAGKSRNYQIMRARHAAICAVKLRWPDISLPLIAREFNRDHTSIMHALRLQGINTSNQKSAA